MIECLVALVVSLLFFMFTLYKIKIGIVFGCNYDKNLQLKFSSCSSLEEVKKYKTSKYTQADIGKNFQEVEANLKNDKYVLFIGTPCQIAGLKNMLKKDYEKLLTIDLICHGVPSQKYLDDYITSLNLEESPDALTFRGKRDFYFTLYKDDKIIYSKKNHLDPFYTAFLDGLFYRENCYSCEYANTHRVR